MNQLTNTTTTILIICTTVTVIALLWALIWAIAWFAANHWRHYYRGLQQQIGRKGETLLKELAEEGKDSPEAKWVARNLAYVAKERTLMPKWKRKDLLEFLR